MRGAPGSTKSCRNCPSTSVRRCRGSTAADPPPAAAWLLEQDHFAE
jgi:hypothetical protein